MDIVFQVLLNSKLQVDVLGRVWDLSDIDKDGMLDKDEFAVVSKPGKFIFFAKKPLEKYLLSFEKNRLKHTAFVKNVPKLKLGYKAKVIFEIIVKVCYPRLFWG